MEEGLKERFAQAQVDVKKLSRKPDNETLLKLYSLYKQGDQGDVTGERPGGFDFVNRAKYDAWAGLKGLSQEEAMVAYVELVRDLLSRG